MNKITQLRETVKSAFPPDNKEVLWIDVSDETNPIQKIYLRGEWKVISGGGSIDPELLEGFIPLSRDFSDDFNNDFAR